MNLLNKKMEVYFGSNRIVNQPKIITVSIPLSEVHEIR